MTRSPTTFTQSAVTRCLKAAKAAGIDLCRVEVDPATGKIVMVTGKPGGVETRETKDIVL
jgi:hypothetical protein